MTVRPLEAAQLTGWVYLSHLKVKGGRACTTRAPKLCTLAVIFDVSHGILKARIAWGFEVDMVLEMEDTCHHVRAFSLQQNTEWNTFRHLHYICRSVWEVILKQRSQPPPVAQDRAPDLVRLRSPR